MRSYIQNGNSITVPKGSTVYYTVELDGYDTISGTILADETKTVVVELKEGYRTFVINTDQENAVIDFEVLNEDGLYTYSGEEAVTYTTMISDETPGEPPHEYETLTYIYEQKRIEFNQPFDNTPIVSVWWKNKDGKLLTSLVEPSVTNYGFVIPVFSNTTNDPLEVYSYMEWSATARTSTNRLTINTIPEDAEVNVEFYKPEVVLTINPTPSDAVVTLTANGYTQNGNSITVEPGTSVNYSVSKNGYTTISNSIVVNTDIVLGVELEIARTPSTVTFTFNNTVNQTDSMEFYINGELVEDLTRAEHQNNNYNSTIVINCYIDDTLTVKSIGNTTFYTFENVEYIIRNGNSQSHTISKTSYEISLGTMVCCVPYYSQILYPNDLTKSAEDVKVGDIIMGYNESTNVYNQVEVLNAIKKSRNDLCKVIFEDDTYMELTPDHPILTNIGWCAYKPETSTAYESMGLIHQLESTQQVLQLNGEYKQIKELQMNYLEQPIDVYTFNTTEGIDTFIAENCVVHNACDK
jgi:hypothetical protein